MFIKSLSVLFLIKKITAIEVQPQVDSTFVDDGNYFQAGAESDLVRKTRSSNFNQFNALMSHIALNFDNLNEDQQEVMTDFMQKLSDEMEADLDNSDNDEEFLSENGEEEETSTLDLLMEESSSIFNPKTSHPKRNMHKKRDNTGNARNNKAEKPKKSAKNTKKTSWFGSLNTSDLGRFYG